MPIYEYECKSCHAVFEDWAKHVDDGTQEKPCPTCGGVAHRIMSQTSFALKGDGWYVTEYGAKKGIKEEGNMGSGAAEKTSGDSLAQPDTSTQPATPERGTPLQQGAPSTGPNPASAAPAEATKSPQPGTQAHPGAAG